MMNSLFFYVFIGLVAGLVRAGQGSYKDAPWEKFKTIKFVRSLFFGVVGGVFWFFLLRFLELEVHPALLMTMVVLFDSIATEVYKRGFRVESLKKYKMPTIVHINGRIIENRLARGIIATLAWFLTFSMFWVVGYVDKSFLSMHSGQLWGVFWGFIAGMMVAIGGATLDSAWEGFNPLKFFRSPIHGAYWGLVFSFFTTSAPILVFACLGMDRMGIEFYKSFLRKMKSGKFKSEKPTHPEWYEVREKILFPYVATWLFFVFLLVAF